MANDTDDHQPDKDEDDGDVDDDDGEDDDDGSCAPRALEEVEG